MYDKLENEIVAQSPARPAQLEIQDEKYTVIRSLIDPRVWFDRNNLDPDVDDFIYWRSVKNTASIFGTLFCFLLAVSLFSLISVIAYVALLLLGICIIYRLFYPLQMCVRLRELNFEHPFKVYLQPDEFVAMWMSRRGDIVIIQLNAFIGKLCRLFLVEDLIESVKFGALLNVFAFIGARVNFLTLAMFMMLVMCTAPKIYDSNKEGLHTLKCKVEGKFGELKRRARPVQHVEESVVLKED